MTAAYENAWKRRKSYLTEYIDPSLSDIVNSYFWKDLIFFLGWLRGPRDVQMHEAWQKTLDAGRRGFMGQQVCPRGLSHCLRTHLQLHAVDQELCEKQRQL